MVGGDASHIGIGAGSRREGRPIACCEKLSEAMRGYSTYDLEYHALVRGLHRWQHYLLRSEFLVYSDHHSFKSQKKVIPTK